MCHTKKPADICLFITVKQDTRNCWNGGKGIWSYQDEIGKASRPTSVSFLIRTSGKETEVATPLSLENLAEIICRHENLTTGPTKTQIWGLLIYFHGGN